MAASMTGVRTVTGGGREIHMSTAYLAHTALVRAYDGEPLQRLIVAAKQDVLYVLNPRLIEEYKNDLTRPIGFRRLDCFAWNDQAFQDLSVAYKATGRTDEQVWIELPPFAGSPIKVIERQSESGRKSEIRRSIPSLDGPR